MISDIHSEGSSWHYKLLYINTVLTVTSPVNLHNTSVLLQLDFNYIPNTLHRHTDNTQHELYYSHKTPTVRFSPTKPHAALVSRRRRKMMTPRSRVVQLFAGAGWTRHRAPLPFTVAGRLNWSLKNTYLSPISSMDTWIKWSSLSFQTSRYAADFILRLWSTNGRNPTVYFNIIGSVCNRIRPKQWVML